MAKILMFMAVTLFAATTAIAGDYQYITAEDLMQKIQTNQQGLLLDIQVEAEYSLHHIPGTIATHAYPVKSEEDQAKLGEALAQVKSNADPVVIVCPRGGGGAKRTYDYLRNQGVDEKRLMILEGGQARWPY